MNNLSKLIVEFSLFLLVTTFVTGCGIVNLPFTGQVTDAETGEPIEGAIIVALWTGNAGLIGARSICYHVESAISDENGGFRIPGWVGTEGFWAARRSATTYAYKRGYEEASVSKVYKNNIKYMDEIKMKKFTGSNAEWFKYLNRLVSRTFCLEAGVSQRALFKFYKAIYEDYKASAKTTDEVKTIDRIRNAAASAGVAAPLDMEGGKAEELKQRFIEEHLK